MSNTELLITGLISVASLLIVAYFNSQRDKKR